MVTFLTVLKSRNPGNDYGMHVGYSIYYPEYVYALQAQIEKHYNKPHRFVCLTDFEGMKCETIKLENNLPGWWSKLEIFRPELVTGSNYDIFVYLDLDTCIVGDITELVEYPHKFSALSQVDSETVAGRDKGNRFASGIMAWRGDYYEIYKSFMFNPVFYMNKHSKDGDQSFLSKFLPDFKPVQEITSGIINYKFELRDKENLPKDANIIYFHAQHKPWRLNHGWIDKKSYDRQ